jgi:hypothetical protein
VEPIRSDVRRGDPEQAIGGFNRLARWRRAPHSQTCERILQSTSTAFCVVRKPLKTRQRGFDDSSSPSASTLTCDILFRCSAAGWNGTECGPLRLFVRTAGAGRSAHFGPFSVSLGHFLRRNRTTAILVRVSEARQINWLQETRRGVGLKEPRSGGVNRDRTSLVWYSSACYMEHQPSLQRVPRPPCARPCRSPRSASHDDQAAPVLHQEMADVAELCFIASPPAEQPCVRIGGRGVRVVTPFLAVKVALGIPPANGIRRRLAASLLGARPAARVADQVPPDPPPPLAPERQGRAGRNAPRSRSSGRPSTSMTRCPTSSTNGRRSTSGSARMAPSAAGARSTESVS